MTHMAEHREFETARTRDLLLFELSRLEREFVENIEESGHQVLSVDASLTIYRWTYTLGLFNTSGQPELISIGLPSGIAGRALNAAAERMRSGVDLKKGRHRDLLGDVEVEFRAADPTWVRELMTSAKWFNGNWDFPVLQLIYPDLENRFQWEDGFTEYFRQPLLQADAPQTQSEGDFRKSRDPESSFYDWAFPDPPHTQAYLSRTVESSEEAVTFVSHDADGDWQFLGDLMSEGGGPVLSCLHHLIDRDTTLKGVADLPLGWYAERDAIGEDWRRFEHAIATKGE